MESHEQRIPAGLFQAMLLDQVARGISQLVDLEKARVQKGMVYQSQVTVGIAVQEIQFIEPIFSLAIVNDGPGGVSYSVNVRGEEAGTVLSGASDTLSFPTAVIKMLYISATEAGTSVRLKMSR